jgi:O-antigen/teichoic acid export membrane protein
MLKIGMPILISLLIGFSLTSADRLIVAGKGEIALLGLYGFAFAMAGISGSLATVIGVVLYPEIYASVAAKGENTALEAHLRGTLLPFARLAPPLLGLLALLIAPIVSFLLPEYVGAIPAARVLIFLGVTAGFTRLGALGIIAAQRQKILPVFSGGALILNVTLSFLALQTGLGLLGVACASVFSHTVHGLAIMSVIVGLAQGSRPPTYLFKVVSPLMWCVTVVFLITSRWALPDMPGLLASVGIYLVAMTPLFPILLSEFRKARKPGTVSILDSN